MVPSRPAQLLVVAIVVAMSARPTTSQNAPLSSAAVENVEVVLRQLDFLALDRSGEPITDLKPGEIRIEDEGIRREILDFLPASAVASAIPPRAPDSPREADAPRGADPTRVTPGEPAPRWIVVYLDARNLSLSGRIRAGKALRDLVGRSVLPADRVSLMVDDGDVRVVLPFGRNREPLIRLLDQADGITATQRDLETRLRTLQEDAEGCREVSNVPECARQAVDSFLLETSRETESSLEHLESLVRSLAAIPDRKILLYVSDGFILNPGDVASAAVEHAIGQINYNLSAMRMVLSRDYSYRIERIYHLASSARVGFYPINMLRRMNDDAFAPERRFDYGPENLPQARSDQFEASWQQVFGLHTGLALATGGVATFKRDPAGEIDRSLRAASGVYAITYQLPFVPTGRRKIKLECTRRGVKLVYRDRYEFLADETVRADGRLIVHTDNYEASGGVVRAEMEVAAGAFRDAGDGKPPVIVASLFFQVTDADMHSLQDHYEIIALPRPTADSGAPVFRRPFAVKLPPGAYALRVEVRDVNGPARASFRSEFRIDAGGEPAERPNGSTGSSAR